jgi:hypothetical protein
MTLHPMVVGIVKLIIEIPDFFEPPAKKIRCNSLKSRRLAVAPQKKKVKK